MKLPPSTRRERGELIVSIILLAVLALYLFVFPPRSFGVMVEPACNARIVAEYSKKLTHPEWFQVVDELERSGTIDNTYAMELRSLIIQAYLTKDLEAWVKRKCP